MTKADDYFQAGQAAYKKGELAKAVETWRMALQEDPLHAKALFHFANATKDIEKKNALEAFNKKGQQLFAAKKYQEALVTWLNILELEPNHVFARTYLEKTREAFQTSKAKNQLVEGNKEELFFKEGLQAFRQKKFADAAIYWEVTLIINPANDQARQGLNKARTAIIQQKDDENQEKQTQINSLLQEGLDLYGSGDVFTAMKKWSRILELDLENKDSIDYIIVAKADLSDNDHRRLKQEFGAPAADSAESATDSIKVGQKFEDRSESIDDMVLEDEAVDMPEETAPVEQITDRTAIPKSMPEPSDDVMMPEYEEKTAPSDDRFEIPDDAASIELDGQEGGGFDAAADDSLDLDDEFLSSKSDSLEPALDKLPAEPVRKPSVMQTKPAARVDDSDDMDLDEFDAGGDGGSSGLDDAVPLDSGDALSLDDDFDKQPFGPKEQEHLEVLDEEIEGDYELDDEFVDEEEEEEQLAAAHEMVVGETSDVESARNLVNKYFDRGMSLFKSRKYEEAIIEWKKIFDIDKTNERAKEYIEKAITLYEASPFIEEHLSKGKELLEASQYEEAIREFEKILEIDSSLDDAAQGIQEARAKLAEVVIPARKTAKVGSEEHLLTEEVIPVKRGFDISQLAQLKLPWIIGGVALLLIIVLSYVLYLKPLQEKNRLLKEQQEQADLKAQRATEIANTISDAQLQNNLKNYEKAKEAWKKVMSLDPQNPAATVGLALAEKNEKVANLLKSGEENFKNRKFEESLAALQQAQELDPENAAIKEKLSEAESRKQLYLEAKAKVDVLLKQGDAFFVEKEYEKAIESYRNALKILPDDEDAKEDIRKAEFEKRRGVNVDANLKLGLSRYESHKYDEAEKYFQEVLKLDPENREATFYLKKIEEMRSIYNK